MPRGSPSADDAVDHGLNVALRKPIDGESRHIRPSDPGRLELWTERHNEQHRKGANPIDDPTERLGRSSAHPQRSSARGFAATMPPPAR